MVGYELHFWCMGPDLNAQASCLLDTPFLHVGVSKTFRSQSFYYKALEGRSMENTLCAPKRVEQDLCTVSVYTGLYYNCFEAIYPSDSQRRTMLQPVSGSWTSILVEDAMVTDRSERRVRRESDGHGVSKGIRSLFRARAVSKHSVPMHLLQAQGSVVCSMLGLVADVNDTYLHNAIVR